MDKASLRKKFLKLRNGQSDEERIIKSISIKEKLMSLPEYRRARTVMFYSSINSEVVTDELVESAHGKKIIGLPKTSKEICCMEINENTEFIEGEYKIPEPVDGRVMPKDEIDLIVIPGIAFDIHGNRLGYGKGYYDRFLKGCNSVRVGVAFDFQLADEIPKDIHDEKIDILVTDKRIVRYGKNKSIQSNKV